MENIDVPDFDDFDIEAASKDELLNFAFAHYGKELSGRDTKDSLKLQLKALMSGTTDSSEPDAPTAPDYEYCLNEKNGRVLIASEGTRRLVSQGMLVPCDKDGNKL